MASVETINTGDNSIINIIEQVIGELFDRGKIQRNRTFDEQGEVIKALLRSDSRITVKDNFRFEQYAKLAFMRLTRKVPD